MKALLFLRYRMLMNGLKSILSSPKRLAVAVPFAAWMILCAFALWVTHLGGPRHGAPALVLPPDIIRLGVVALLLLFTATGVERGVQGAAFSFTGADYEYLFASPISRRLIVVQRVLGDALTTGLWVGITLLFITGLMPVRIAPAVVTLRDAIALWLAGWLYAVAVVNGSRVVELAIDGFGELYAHSRVVLRVVVWVVVLGVFGGWGLSLATGRADLQAISEALARPPIVYVLAPMLSVAAIMTGDGYALPGEALGSLALLLPLALAAGVAVCFLDKDVVEATLEHSARSARMRRAAKEQDWEGMTGAWMSQRSPRSRTWLVGWSLPDLALPYAYLAELLHGNRLRWLVWGAVLVIPGLAGRLIPLPDRELSVVALVAGGYVLLVSASFATMRFRSEIGHLTVLRTMPIATWRQVLGMVAPRAAVQSLAMLLALLSFALGRPALGPTTCAVLALCLPLGCGAALLVAAITAYLFPLGGDAGQRFVGGLLLTFGVSLALAPCTGAVVAGLTLGLSSVATGMLANVSLLPSVAIGALCATWALDRLQPREE